MRDFTLIKLNKQKFDEVDLEIMDLSSSDTKTINSSVPVSMIKFLTIMCLILCSSAQSCSDEFFITGTELVQCTHSNNLVDCIAQVSSLFTLHNLQSTACLTVKDPISEASIATMSITYESGYWVCPTIPRFYTSDWSTVLSSTKKCPSEQYCNPSQNCDTFNLDNYNAYGLLSGLSTTLPGVTNCLNTCGGWGCSCALFDNSCTYSRWAVNPIGSVYSVNQINECVFNAKIKVSITDSDNETQTLYIPTSGPVTWGSFTFGFTGILPVTMPNILSYDILTDGSTFYKIPIASLGSTTPGVIGDIQGSTSSSIQRPTRTSFDFAHTLCSTTTTNTAFKVDCSKSAVSTAKISAPKMPIISSFGVTTVNGQDQYVLLADPPTIVLELTSLPVHFQREISIVCPVGGPLSEVSGNPLLQSPLIDTDEFVVTGCFNCPQGFQAAIVVASECAEGLVDVSFENDLTSSVKMNIKTLYLRTSWDVAVISMQSDTKLVKGNILLKGKTHEFRIAISATLMDPLIILNTNGSNTNSINSVVNNTIASLQDPFLVWWDSIVPSLPFMKYLIVGAIGITSIILIVVIIKAIVR